MFKFKRIFKDLKFGVLKPKAFIILFVLFFSSLAIAATLTVTWKDGRIPQGNAACTSFDVKINSNYSLSRKIPDYGANIEVSSTF